MLGAKTQKLRAKGQEPKTAFFPHSRDLSNGGGDVLLRNASLSDTLQSTRGRGSWDPNGRPQSTGLQAFPGLPADAALGLASTNYRRKASFLSIEISLGNHAK